MEYTHLLLKAEISTYSAARKSLHHLASAGLFLDTIDQPEIVFMFTLLGDIEGHAVTSAYDQFTAFKKAH
jgi:hypothetical protein